uniref:Peptide Hp1478 n=1 Tax=Heterometrus petersii TaxID=754296 RepID=NDB4X_HETPE|nr:RecName: Full=Peptide Hp1478 [Heterometrus petersii]
ILGKFCDEIKRIV